MEKYGVILKGLKVPLHLFTKVKGSGIEQGHVVGFPPPPVSCLF